MKLSEVRGEIKKERLVGRSQPEPTGRLGEENVGRFRVDHLIVP